MMIKTNFQKNMSSKEILYLDKQELINGMR